jgi:XTP/dITP diphosphohydrolase
MQLLFASANQHKIAEIKTMLPSSIQLLGLKDVGIFDDVPETGLTIKENSFLKAKFVAEHINYAMPVFADDSGLEVNALQGAPGVYSARYAGELKNDQRNNEKLLQELTKQVSNLHDRSARFVTIITLFINKDIHYFEGEIKGDITHELKGINGFGFDPLFIPNGHQSTFAELISEVKNDISHRAAAVRKLVRFIEILRSSE